ncbi:MAG: EscU/YscU/HrcU family type III secretion system export apparatus switch protein [Oscillospiraceae bacterium]|jgi:flagellar biosynthesis protein|nr:EscU/YscU/HrcU family type III secretion system export apparatus switch protein [Oscillospiraceae bacterium]
MGKSDKRGKRAAAIKYDPADHSAPVLAAFGEGFVAEKIIEAAEEAGVPVMPDPDLASMLARLSIGDEIPPSLYEVVAKVLLFVSELDRDYGDKLRKSVK